MVYGNNGFCTELMRQFSGRVIGKRGAAGVYLSGVVGQCIGCAVKIDDGTMGPQYNVTMEFLHWLTKHNKLLPPRVNEGETDSKDLKDLQLILNNLEKYRVTQSLNSMGIHVGDTKCIDGLFPNTL